MPLAVLRGIQTAGGQPVALHARMDRGAEQSRTARVRKETRVIAG